MNILVTGGAGYIGSKLCYDLTKSMPDSNVIVFDNLYYNQWRYVKKYWSDTNIEFYKEDILLYSQNLISAIQNADFIIPLAAIVGAPACDKDPVLSTNINYTWYERLLTLLNSKQKIIYPNTNSGYGTTPGNTVCTEQTPSNPISLYGKLKQQTENLLLSQYDNTICFRLATVFGLSGRPRLDLLVNNFVYRAVKNNVLDIFDGHFRRNFISVNDISRAFIFAINNFENMKGQVFNLGADSLNSNKLEFARTIQKLLGCNIIEHSNKTDPDKRDYVVSSQKLYNCGFEIQDTTLDKNVLELAEFCKNLTDTNGMFNY